MSAERDDSLLQSGGFCLRQAFPLFSCFSCLLDLTFHVNALPIVAARLGTKRWAAGENAWWCIDTVLLLQESASTAKQMTSLWYTQLKERAPWMSGSLAMFLNPAQLSPSSALTYHVSLKHTHPHRHTDMWCEYATCLLVDRLAKEPSWILSRHMWAGKERVTHTQNNLHRFLCANNQQRKPKHATMETEQLFWMENTGRAM